MNARLHPTALVEPGVEIGDGTAVWDNVHIRSGARIGRDCIIGEKSYIAGGTVIGDRVKINAFVYICAGVTIEDGVMVAAGTIFTNDRFPRATTPDLSQLRSSDVDEHTRPTLVRAGATIGAGCIVGCDLEIGRFAMVGMGSVVTRPVPDFHLAIGQPARVAGTVCRCGQPLGWGPPCPKVPGGERVACGACGRGYLMGEGVVREEPPETARLAPAGG